MAGTVGQIGEAAMRNQTISTSLSDAAQLIAEPVDTAGWLAGAVPLDEPSGGVADHVDIGSRRGRRPARRAVRRHRGPRPGGRAIVRPLVQESAGTPEIAPVAVSARHDDDPDGYRMGRWARLALTVTVLAAVLVLTVTLTAGSAPSRLIDVTVGPGDTLWSIAAVAAPDRDPRAVIDEIRDLNDLPDNVLPIGVVLRVPSSAD